MSECPKPELLKPCNCDNEVILCGGNQYYNLKHLFESLSNELTDDKKHFKRFYFNNTAITELKENTFYDLTFDEIYFESASNLTTINTHTFTATNLVTKRFETQYTPIANPLPDSDIFKILSFMIKIEYIRLDNTKITEIPSYAFRPLLGYQNNLRYLYIRSRTGGIQKVANYVFYDLNSMLELSLDQNMIDFIPSNAFHFRKESKINLNLYLSANHLNGSSFESNAFNNIKRPTILNLEDNPKISYLDQKIFSTFLNSDPNNQISVTHIKLDCNDCRSYWITKEPGYLHRILNIECTNGKLFTDLSNFANCN
jgi:hypothetical protein